MAMDDKRFSASIVDVYDDYMVPLIFEIYAEDMATRVASHSPKAVLETAAGTGVVPRALAPLLRGARYAVTDLNAPMLDRAKARQSGKDDIEWKPADAQKLPFEDASFDVACCQFGAMFFPDQRAAFEEVRRVLRPGGHWIFSVWDRIERNEFADVVTEAAASYFPSDPPRFLARTPHGHFDPEKLSQTLSAAGFTDIEVDTVERRSVAGSARFAAMAYCQGTPLRTEIEARDPACLDDVTERAADAIATRFGHGSVDGEIRALVFTARA